MTNYFDFFEIDPAPVIDEALLRKIFLLNSKKFHPDFYTMESSEKQAHILELSTLNNQAYKVLKDYDQRLKHLLTIKNILGKEGENKLPQAFLMEMMDINESIMELQFNPSEQQYAKIQSEVSAFENTLNESTAQLIQNYNDKTVTEEELLALKNYYLKKRYLLRIHENLSTFAPQ